MFEMFSLVELFSDNLSALKLIIFEPIFWNAFNIRNIIKPFFFINFFHFF